MNYKTAYVLLLCIDSLILIIYQSLEGTMTVNYLLVCVIASVICTTVVFVMWIIMNRIGDRLFNAINRWFSEW